EAWETELDERIEPRCVEGVSELVQVRCDVTDVRGDEMRQKPTVVQCGTPTHQAAPVRRLPEARDQRAQQKHLHRAHPRMRRHLESAEFEQTQPPGRALRRIELVDRELGAMRVAGEIGEEVTQQTIDQPRLRGVLAGAVLAFELLEGDLEFVESIVARFIDARRLTGRADEKARKKIRERGVVL